MDVKAYTHDLLFEIGAEEMPSGPLYDAAQQLEVNAGQALRHARLHYRDLTVYFTPRRLSLLVRGLADQQAEETKTVRGPKTTYAYDVDTKEPTKALTGFLAKNALTAADITIIDDVVTATVTTAAEKTTAVLPALLTGLITSISWKKPQRWGSGDEKFIRPVRWLLAIYGAAVVPLRFGDIIAGNTTRGHRFLSRGPVTIAAMREYKNVLRGNHVIVDAAARRAEIVSATMTAADAYGAALIDDTVLAEVVNLTEFPNALVGAFDEEFLRVPREILQYAMSTHQRYFAIQRPDGKLDNHFVVISNGDPARAAAITAGHNRVVRARLADAAFFYDEDLRAGLNSYRDRLADLTFVEGLGSMKDKTERVRPLVQQLCEQLEVPAQAREHALRAAELAKADLTSNVVIEFTELQGVMGAYYALAQGEDRAVATAIAEHYRPRFAGDELPSTLPGQLVSLADKLDTLASIFSIGKAPKGSSDPLGLRRAAIGVIRIAMEQVKFDYASLLAAALRGTGSQQSQGDSQMRSLTAEVQQFLTSRLEAILRDKGFSAEVVAAVLPVVPTNPADALARCEALRDFVAAGDDYLDLSVAFTRAKNLSQPDAGTAVDVSLLDDYEQTFYEALSEAAPRAESYRSQAAWPDYLMTLAALRGPVDDFFENVMVMSDDERLRRNRLALLNTFVALVETFADFRALSGA